MSEEPQKMDWAFYFSTLSKECLFDISHHLQQQLQKKINEDKDTNPIVSASEIQLVHHGEKIRAIKNYRDRTGAGLVEAKRAVEQAYANWRGH